MVYEIHAYYKMCLLDYVADPLGISIFLVLFSSIILCVVYFSQSKGSTFYLPSKPCVANDKSALHIQELWVYPMKSCAGISLRQASLTLRGIMHGMTLIKQVSFFLDREFMVVRSKNGVFVSQRQYPQMCLIRTAFESDSLLLFFESHPLGPLILPLDKKSSSLGEYRRVSIWSDVDVNALDQGDHAALWISFVIDRKTRLDPFFDNKTSSLSTIPPFRIVRCPPETTRLVSHSYRKSEFEQCAFADGFPYLLTSVKSLEKVSTWAKEDVPMNRFRPNIVVSGAQHAFAEDWWESISIGNQLFRLSKPCSRCTIPQIDQKVGRRGKEPLKSLKTHRLVNEEVYFGQNLVCTSFPENVTSDQEFANIRVGDAIRIEKIKQNIVY